jgi:hypothetical protein
MPQPQPKFHPVQSLFAPSKQLPAAAQLMK